MHFTHFLSNNFKYASDAQNDMYSSNSLCSMLRGRLAFEIIYVRKRIQGNTRKKKLAISGSIFKFIFTLASVF